MEKTKNRGVIGQCFEDSDLKISSKRVIVFLSFAVMLITFICDVFFDITVSEFIYDSFETIVLVGIGVIGTEKLFKAVEDRKRSNEGNSTGGRGNLHD